jgi:hypothetical protein
MALVHLEESWHSWLHSKNMEELWVISPPLDDYVRKENFSCVWVPGTLVTVTSAELIHDLNIQMEILNTEILSQLLRVHISTTYSDLVEMCSPHGGVLTNGFPRFPLAGNWILLCWLPMVINLYFTYWIEYFHYEWNSFPFLNFSTKL